jgi:cytochrome c oxidase subunit 3
MTDINQTDQEPEVSEKEQMEKAKRNLVYVGIASIMMLFGGLSSAYIVSMGDSFWLKFPLPKAFWISTAIIIVSSITIQLSLSAVRRGNLGGMKLLVSLTLILGFLFTLFQFRGYKKMVENGVHVVGNLIVTEGRYGDYYEVKYKGDFIEVKGSDYLLKGKDMTDNELKDYQNFMSQFLKLDDNKPFEVKQYGKDFEVYFENVPLELNEGQLMTKAGKMLEFVDRKRLHDLAIHVRDERGDFYIKGELGKDFQIYYKGEELQYVDREFKFKGRTLTNYERIKIMETPDTASSYLYLITFVHLLHILVSIIYLIKVVIRSFTGKIDTENNIGLQTGAIFWHFLGLLWLYLLLFLLFIH